MTEAAWQVRTIEFDWAGVEGLGKCRTMLDHGHFTW